MLIDYSSLGVAPPTAERMVDSVFGLFRYDLNFLLAFRPLCRKKPTLDWESRVVNMILRSDDIGLNAGRQEDDKDDDDVPDLDDGEESDEATLHPDDDDSEGDEVTLATPKMSTDYTLMPRSSWLSCGRAQRRRES